METEALKKSHGTIPPISMEFPLRHVKSLFITIVVACVTVWATDFLIHAVWEV